LKQKIGRKYVTIRGRLVWLKSSRGYWNILRISRSKSKIEKPSNETIQFTKTAEATFAVDILHAVESILKRRINRSRNEDAEIEKFLKSLQKWVKIILPAYEFSMEYWRQEFQDQFYLEQARKD
jgi:hypothetical protein